MPKGNITLLVSEHETTIEIYDGVSRECIVKVTLTPEQFCQALGRLSHTECTLRMGHLDRVGKKMVMEHLVFPMSTYDRKNRKEIACVEANKICPPGWTPDNYYGSQDSFFRDENGIECARTVIRKWVYED